MGEYGKYFLNFNFLKFFFIGFCTLMVDESSVEDDILQ